MKTKCPLCDFENEEGSKFCKNCNEPLLKPETLNYKNYPYNRNRNKKYNDTTSKRSFFKLIKDTNHLTGKDIFKILGLFFGLVILIVIISNLFSLKTVKIPKKTKTSYLTLENSIEVKEYYVDLNVEDMGSRQIKTNIKTNFPDGTNLHIWVKRIYYESGDLSIRYAGDIFSKNISVKDGKIDLLIDVNDSDWYNEYYKKAEEYKGIIDYPGISHISPEVDISVLFTPKGNHPIEILKIF